MNSVAWIQILSNHGVFAYLRISLIDLSRPEIQRSQIVTDYSGGTVLHGKPGSGFNAKRCTEIVALTAVTDGRMLVMTPLRMQFLYMRALDNQRNGDTAHQDAV
jgi:hypothetical protein